jgi:hypothetical protein
MTTTQQREQHNGMRRHEREALDTLIGEQVVHVLGRPSDLLRVTVRPLWDSYYRVNVFVGPDAASAKVANSYFLEANADGLVITSTPKITKQY